MIRTLDDFCAALEWATEKFYLQWKIERQAIRAPMQGVIGMYPTCPIAAVCRAEGNRWVGVRDARQRLGMPHDLTEGISIASDCNMNLLTGPTRNIRRQILQTILRANARQKILLTALERRK